MDSIQIQRLHSPLNCILEKASYALATSIIQKRRTMLNFSLPKRELGFLAGLLAVAFIVRVLLFPQQGYHNDIATYQYWFNTAAENGIRPFYTVVLQQVGWIDYPPFNVYIFWVFGSLAQALSTWGIDAANIVKLAPNLFDMATGALIYIFLRKQLTYKQSLIGTGLYVFNPAIIFNAAVWGQFDAIYTFFLVLSLILALKSKPKSSAAVFAVALLTKPQAIALAPLIAYLIFRKNGLKSLLTSLAVFVATVFVVILPFDWNGNPITFLSNIYFGAYGGYAYTSINAFNLWGMFGLWQPDANFFLIGWAMFGAFAVFLLYVLHKRFKASSDILAVFCAFMLLFAFFMLPTRIHERYLFPAISMLALLFPLAKKTRPFYIVLTATLLINQAYVLSFLNNNAFIPSGDIVVLAVSVINLIMFLYGAVLMWDELKARSLHKTDAATLSLSSKNG
jgi:dolichyl-phosphate-mannose-protein mannosyltransferase